MRILHLLPSIASTSGGPVRAVLSNVRALHRQADPVETLLVSTDHGLESGWLATLSDRLPARVTLKLFRAGTMPPRAFSWSLLRWLREIVADVDLMVLETLFNPLCTAAARVARATGTRYVVVPHGMLSRYTFGHRRRLRKRTYYRLLERETLEGARRIRFTTVAERAEAERLGLRTEGSVVPHPYEPELPPRGSPDERSGVLFLGRLDPKKGLDLLLPAFRRVLDARPDERLIIAGAGASGYERWLRREIRSSGLERAVALEGFVEGEEKRRLLERAALFVLPSYNENFGLAVVEAMAAGISVVVTDNVGIWTDIRDFGAGMVVEPRVDQLASAIGTLISEPGRREQMGRSGRALVAKCYDPRVVGGELVRLYRGALGLAAG